MVLAEKRAEEKKDEKIVLHANPPSFYSQRVLLALKWKGLNYDLKVVRHEKGEAYDPEYLKINPKGLIPTIQHNGKNISESSDIMYYLELDFDDEEVPRLLPKDKSEQRHRIEYFHGKFEALNMAALTFGAFQHPELFNLPKGRPIESYFEDKLKNLQKHQLNYEEGSEMYKNYAELIKYTEERQQSILSKDDVKSEISKVRDLFEEIEKELAKRNKAEFWLLGTERSFADVDLAVTLARFKVTEYYESLMATHKFPHIEKYFNRLLLDQAFRETCPLQLPLFIRILDLAQPLMMIFTVCLAILLGYIMLQKAGYV